MNGKDQRRSSELEQKGPGILPLRYFRLITIIGDQEPSRHCDSERSREANML